MLHSKLKAKVPTMVKWLLRILVLIIIELGGVLLVKDDPGFVLIKYHDYSLETSLAFGTVVLIFVVVVIYFSLRFLLGFWRLPSSGHWCGNSMPP